MDFEQAYEQEKALRMAAELALDEKAREVESSLNTIQYQYESLLRQKSGVEMLLNVAQMGELQLPFRQALQLFTEAIGQMFDTLYTSVFLATGSGGEFRNSTICYLPQDYYVDKVLYLLSGDRTFELDSPVGKSVISGNHVIPAEDVLGITEYDPEVPERFLYFTIRKGNGLVAVLEAGVRDWNRQSETSLPLASIACKQFGLLLERAEASRQLHDNYVDLKTTHEQLVSAQTQLLHSEKMASIGQLAAGVAHEINNPVGFVLSNVDTLKDYLKVVLEIQAAYEQMVTTLNPEHAETEALQAHIANVKRRSDFDFIIGDIGKVIKESADGLERVKEIVLSLKNFARADEGDRVEAVIDEIIENGIKMIWNEVKYHVALHKDLSATKPVMVNPTQLSQVIVNLVINAAQAIKQQGHIWVRSWQTESITTIVVEDDGCGIPPHILSQIFNPFFTTKPMDTGTGLGLSISHGIIENHGGSIRADSAVGKGTTFTIELPII